MQLFKEGDECVVVTSAHNDRIGMWVTIASDAVFNTNVNEYVYMVYVDSLGVIKVATESQLALLVR